MDDAELLAYTKARVGEEHGLSEAQSQRLQGLTLTQLHDDAAKMCAELGLRDRSPTRDGEGRFQARPGEGGINAVIRQAAGRA
jgi:hypothetical protein